MKKGWISIICGIVIGLIISYFFLDYKGLQIVYLNTDGDILNKVNELDFKFLSNAFSIIVITSGIIYFLLTKIDKRNVKQENR